MLPALIHENWRPARLHTYKELTKRYKLISSSVQLLPFFKSVHKISNIHMPNIKYAKNPKNVGNFTQAIGTKINTVHLKQFTLKVGQIL